MIKGLHPYRDAHGALFPELDQRWVTGVVMIHYTGGCRSTLWKRTLAGDFGKPGREAGLRLVRRTEKDRGHYEYRPAVIWRVLRLGRYGDPAWDARQIEGRFPIYWCAADQIRATAGPSQGNPHLEQTVAQLSTAVLHALGAITGRPIGAQLTIPFPGPTLAPVKEQ